SGPVETENPYNHNYEITAPGSGILSTFPSGSYQALSGTSMAAPIVAGAVLLMKDHDPSQSNEEIFARIIQSANYTAIQGLPHTVTSIGLLDIENCLGYTLQPDLSYLDFTLNDNLPDCDNDGIADAGETIHLYLTVKNAGGQASNVRCTLAFGEFEDNTVAIINQATSVIGDISTYATMSGESDPFIITIDPATANNRDIVFQYTITSDNHADITDEIVITVQNGFEIGGIIIENTVFTADKEYILTDNLRIAEGATLTIEPGTTIKFDPDNRIDVRGSLIAVGTPENMITFTKNQDGLGNGLLASSSINGSDIHLSYVIIEYQGPAFEAASPDGDLTIENCLFTNCDGINGSYFDVSNPAANMSIEKNMFYNNRRYIRFTPNSSTISRSFKYNNIVNNFYGTYPFWFNYNWIESTQSNFQITANSIFSNHPDNNNANIYISGNNSYVDITTNYWGCLDIDSIQSTILDFQYSSSNPVAVFEPILTQPSALAHAIVWKVEINDVLVNKYDNPYNSPTGLGIVGNEELEFKVYFNREMNPQYEPFLTFGVREPYTQNIVHNNSSWNEENTIWTAYVNVGLNTGDGINRIRVANARDLDNFEIPIERDRFEFVIQAAGSQSNSFQATAGIGLVNLEWPDAEVEDVLGYNMYRYTNITETTFTDTVIINSQLITDTNYTDYNVEPDQTYYYQYTAIKTDMQESDFSKTVSATPFNTAAGDANGDLAVNVLDITTIVSYLLNQNPQPFLFDGADANQDGQVNVLDIVFVVNIINSRQFTTIAAKIQNKPKLIPSSERIKLQYGKDISALQIQLRGNNLTDETRLIAGDIVRGMEFTYHISDDLITVIIYSLSNKLITADMGELFSITNGKITGIESIIASDQKGNEIYVEKTEFEEVVPTAFFVNQNYPNPFNPETKIEYGVAEMSDVRFSVYNIRGQRVFEINESQKTPGIHYFVWKGIDHQQKQVSSGIYFYKIKTGSHEKVGKMLLLK
ncbi:MAG: S8 family serine peptidase, partial [Candidatus Cloacimonetes bacterium]|nr:S8 family serine peptidase [Candidatus Cloacimonadota bacterium]